MVKGREGKLAAQVPVMFSEKMQWLRDDCAFMAVHATAFALAALAMIVSTSFMHVTGTMATPGISTIPSRTCRMASFAVDGSLTGLVETHRHTQAHSVFTMLIMYIVLKLCMNQVLGCCCPWHHTEVGPECSRCRSQRSWRSECTPSPWMPFPQTSQESSQRCCALHAHSDASTRACAHKASAELVRDINRGAFTLTGRLCARRPTER
jgi:hypothetical protein